jgi:Domain of unknown function (DUF5615)
MPVSPLELATARTGGLVGTLASELRPIAAGMGDAPRVYADANLPAGVIAFMRHELHWNVLFVVEHDDLRRAPDTTHFRLAQEYGRTLVTLDRDFLDDRRFPPAEGAGVIVCSAPNETGLTRLLAHVDRQLLRLDEADPLPLRGRKLELHPDLVPGPA